jgi:hypothetical protein
MLLDGQAMKEVGPDMFLVYWADKEKEIAHLKQSKAEEQKINASASRVFELMANASGVPMKARLEELVALMDQRPVAFRVMVEMNSDPKLLAVGLSYSDELKSLLKAR